jgi:molybdopterin-guanine dinucleotide biosynthesis protein A
MPFHSTRKIAGVTGVLLVGGESRRFGADKVHTPWRGEPLARAGLKTLVKIFARVLVVGKTDPKLGSEAEFVPDESPAQNPLGGILTALDRAPSDRIFVVAGDMPLVQESLIRLICARPGPTVVPLWDGVPQPLCAVYAKTGAEVLRRHFARGSGPSATLSDLAADLVPMDVLRAADPEGLSFLDVDTPGDWERIRALG